MFVFLQDDVFYFLTFPRSSLEKAQHVKLFTIVLDYHMAEVDPFIRGTCPHNYQASVECIIYLPASTSYWYTRILFSFCFVLMSKMRPNLPCKSCHFFFSCFDPSRHIFFFFWSVSAYRLAWVRRWRSPPSWGTSLEAKRWPWRSSSSSRRLPTAALVNSARSGWCNFVMWVKACVSSSVCCHHLSAVIIATHKPFKKIICLRVILSVREIWVCYLRIVVPEKWIWLLCSAKHVCSHISGILGAKRIPSASCSSCAFTAEPSVRACRRSFRIALRKPLCAKYVTYAGIQKGHYVAFR